MKINRIYNETSNIEDSSNDKVVITMSQEEFWKLENILNSVKQNWICKIDIERAETIIKEIEEAIKNETTEWTK